MQTKFERIIRAAYEKGYRVTSDGRLIGLKGKELTIKLCGKQRYPTFSVSCNATRSGVFGIPVHKFAAFCFYETQMFEPGIVVRHINNKVMDFSDSNITLGTHSQNNLDKSPSIRKAAARKARAAQGYRAINAVFNEDQVRAIREKKFTRGGKAAIAKELGVSKTTITYLINRRTYKDVE